MKKYKKIIYAVLAILTIVLLVDIYNSYMTPERLLRMEVEDQLKESLNDPSSYEFVEFYKNPISIENKNPNAEYFTLEFRGKNKLGALILDEVKVQAERYNPEDTDSKYILIGFE